MEDLRFRVGIRKFRRFRVSGFRVYGGGLKV